MHKSTQNSPVPSIINKTVSLHFKHVEGEMELVKYFQKQTDRPYRCTIPVKKKKQSRNKPAPCPPRRQCVPGVRLRLKTAGVRHVEEFLI